MANLGGKSYIGERVYICVDALIEEGVTIDNDAIIDIGAVVHNDIPTT